MRNKVLVAVLGICLCGLARAENLVVGGDFEGPVVKDGESYEVNVTPTGWAGTGDLVKQEYAGAVDSGNGKQWFDLNPGMEAGNGIMQSVHLTAGITYTFSFRYNGGGGGSTSAIAYQVGDLVGGSVSTADMNVYGGTAWKTWRVTFTAKVTGAADVRFVPNGKHAGGFIDAVEIHAGGEG